MIDIPEDVKAVIDRKGTNETVAETLWQAVKNGTPLQEGHGRLIDADALQEDCLWWETEKEVSLAPTIIEADKEVET